MLRLQRYDVNFTYRPGKEIEPADTLSRNPNKSSLVITDDASRHASVCLLAQASDAKLEQVRRVTLADPQLQEVVRYVEEGWPVSCKYVSADIKPYSIVKMNFTLIKIFCAGDSVWWFPMRCDRRCLKLFMKRTGG